jgi:hypothetical protein
VAQRFVLCDLLTGVPSKTAQNVEGKICMIARYAIRIVALLASAPALAASLDATAAQRFVLGKLFAFACFDGSRGAGRVYGDGSVIGTIQLRGSGPSYSVSLPAGTLKVKGETVCASLDGIPFEPCFDLNRTDDQSFRGSVSGFDFAYCDFTHHPDINGRTAHLRPSEPLSLDAMRYKRVK